MRPPPAFPSASRSPTPSSTPPPASSIWCPARRRPKSSGRRSETGAARCRRRWCDRPTDGCSGFSTARPPHCYRQGGHPDGTRIRRPRPDGRQHGDAAGARRPPDRRLGPRGRRRGARARQRRRAGRLARPAAQSAQAAAGGAGDGAGGRGDGTYDAGAGLMSASEYGLDLPKIAELWNQGSVVRSWLLELTAAALADDPRLEGLKGYVEDSGEGRWTVEDAIEKAVPLPTITASLFARFRSRRDNSFADRLLAALRNQFGGHAVRR